MRVHVMAHFRRLARADLMAAVVLAICGLAYLLLARFALDAFPVSGDEHSYLLQGQVFSRGHLAVPAPPNARLFEVDHVVIDDRVRSKYPPGWPGLLALGFALGAPWAVSPVCAVLALALIYGAARRLDGAEAALVGTVLVGLSPFFALNAASFHSHVPALLFEAAFVFSVLRGMQGLPDDPAAQPQAPGTSLVWAAAGGGALGGLMLIRPADAILCGLPLIVVRRRPAFVMACIGGALAVGWLSFAYNAAQFGSPWRSGYAAYDPMARKLFGDRGAATLSLRYLNPIDQWNHLGWFADLALWLVPGTLVLAIVGLARPEPLDVRRRFVRALVVTPCLVVPFLASSSGDGYGPRYLFPTLVPLALAAAHAWVRLGAWLDLHPAVARGSPGRRKRGCELALVAMLAAGLVRAGMFTEQHHVNVLHRSSLYRRVHDMGLEHVVVVIKSRAPTFFARNLSVFDGPIIYVSPWGMTDHAIAALFPDRSVYSAEQHLDEKDWTVTAVP